jgi:hypothetical protein
MTVVNTGNHKTWMDVGALTGRSMVGVVDDEW